MVLVFSTGTGTPVVLALEVVLELILALVLVLALVPALAVLVTLVAGVEFGGFQAWVVPLKFIVRN